LQVDVFSQSPTKVTDHDLDPNVVENVFLVHRNLTYAEKVVNSNERELLAAVELILGCLKYIKNTVFTLHFDNMNAATILEKGSPKFRLQNYAIYVANLCTEHNFVLRPVWIPRCLNNVADILSKMVDYDDYSVEEEFFQYILQITGYIPNFDRFANNWNSKCPQFNSLTYCIGSGGVDAFNYSWGGNAKNWIFPPPRLIIPALIHLQKCYGNGIILIPQWKSASFYPFIMEYRNKNVAKRWVLPGKNIFRRGADNTTCFGPDFVGNVEIWLFNFKP
jgi:hypothetical protein